VETRRLVRAGGRYTLRVTECEEGEEAVRAQLRAAAQGPRGGGDQGPRTPLKTPLKGRKGEKGRRREEREEEGRVTLALELDTAALGTFLSAPAAMVLERGFAQRQQVGTGSSTPARRRP
jgi:hypothetical protein